MATLKLPDMRFIAIAMIFIISPIISFPQSIHGTVFDEKTNAVLTGVNILLKRTKEGTSTNNNGQFNLQSNSTLNSLDTLQISYVGYITKKLTVDELILNNQKVYLTEDIQKLEEITITTSRLLKSEIDYEELESLKKGVYSFGSNLIENKIYIEGGDLSHYKDMAKEVLFESGYGNHSSLIESLERTSSEFSWQEYSGNLCFYDILNDTWEYYDLEFRKRAYHNLHFHDNKIYILGGKQLSKNRRYEYLEDKIEVFDFKSDTILIDHTNPHQAVNFASFIYKNNLIVLGGSTHKKKNGEKEFTNKAHLYDLQTGYWYELNNMPHPKETKGVLIKDKIYLIGGFNLKPLKEIESFNLTTGKWESEGELFHEAERPALTFHDNIIYILEKNRFYTYSIETRELNEYFIRLDLMCSELHFANNKLYIVGGYYEDEVSITPSPKLFCVDVSEFEKTKAINSKIL